MAEYIVEFDKTPYDHMVAAGIIKEADNPTLYGMPVNVEIIRCRDCMYFVSDEDPLDPGHPMECELHGIDMVSEYCFCAWAERDA